MQVLVEEEDYDALAAFGGSGEIFGLNNLTGGTTKGEKAKTDALKKAKALGFKGA